MKIMLVAQNKNFYGGEKIVFQIAMFLKNKKDVSDILVVTPGKGTFNDILDTHGIKNVSSCHFSTFSFKALPNFLKIASNFKPDIIHSHALQGHIFSRIVSSVKKIPVICTNHVPNDWTYKKLGWRAFWYKFIDVFTNLIAYKIVNTGVSDYVTATMKHLKNVKIVENGVETPEIKYEIPKKIRRFGYMGRIVNIKGVEEIILAFDKLRKEKNDVSLIIKGSDITPKKKWISKYKKIVTNKNIPVIFEDFSNDIESFYSKIDCYVLFTYPGFEGFSLTSLESVFRNRLIISSEDGAPIIKKYIKESIVPSKNIEKLYEKMLEFHEYSENDIKNIIKKYDILKKKYNLKTMCENYYEIYKQVVKK